MNGMIDRPTFEPILNLLALGGPVVVLLLALSIFALALAIIKLVEFRRFGVGNHKIAWKSLALWQSGDRAAAMRMASSRSSAVTVKATLLVMQALSKTGSDKRGIEDALATFASERLHELQKGLRALDTIAQLAPLLGLFGTVLGMIEAFRKLQDAGSAVDPSLLAGGIWVALLTTAAGLALAMPASAVLTWFETRLENERVALETLAGRLLNGDLSQNSPVIAPVDRDAAIYAY